MIDNYMLYKNIPVLDLHGYDRYSAVYEVNVFINDNIKLGNKLLKIVHGIGEGIVKNEVHNCLKKRRDVKEYKIDKYNPGATLVELY